MPTDSTIPCSRPHRLAAVIAALMLVVPSAYAGHDQVEDDLTYFLPMPPARAKQLLDAGEKILFFDLREAEEFRQQHLPGAVSLPLRELPSQFAKVPRAGRVVLYCGCGPGNIEEGYSYQILREQGYRNVSVLEGGISEWQRLGYPLDAEPRS
jgi:rhodanese-related sulfurtransferase